MAKQELDDALKGGVVPSEMVVLVGERRHGAISDEQLKKWRELCDNATAGPWRVWDGPSYEGGGADLCIGAGEAWLANMDHRRCEYKRMLAMREFDTPHKMDVTCDPPGQCDVCSIVDDDEITVEQRANAEFIAQARSIIPELIDEIVALRRLTRPGRR
jgi:hypothetical protein